MSVKNGPENATGIEAAILTVRGLRVILDTDLARLYGVPTKRLNEQVRRNAERFPPDFVFQLTPEEVKTMRSQFATGYLYHADNKEDRANWSQIATTSLQPVGNRKDDVNRSSVGLPLVGGRKGGRRRAAALQCSNDFRFRREERTMTP